MKSGKQEGEGCWLMGEVRLESGWRTVIGGVRADKGREGDGEERTIVLDLKNRFYPELAGVDKRAVVMLGPGATKEMVCAGMEFPVELRVIEHCGMLSRTTYCLEIPSAEAFPWEDRLVPCGHGNHYFVKWEKP